METGQIIIGDVMPDASVPVLNDGPAMDLPSNATLNPDGTVTLLLDYPKQLKFRLPGTDQVARTEDFTSLTFRRLTGADVRKVIGAKDSAQTAMSLASGLGFAKLTLLQSVLDAADEFAAAEVVRQLLGGLTSGLPPQAVSTPEGVTLDLFYPAADEQGTVYTQMVFKRLTAFQRKQAQASASSLDWAVATATGTTPKLAASLVDAMDGADAVAVNHVVLFLFGSGR